MPKLSNLARRTRPDLVPGGGGTYDPVPTAQAMETNRLLSRAVTVWVLLATVLLVAPQQAHTAP